MKTKYWIVPAILVFALIVVLVAVGMFKMSKGRVLIVNAASESLSSGTLKVCDQIFIIGNLRAGETKEIQYKVRSDSHYSISIKFSSGVSLIRNIGYVTHGLDFNDTLLVVSDDIIIENNLKYNKNR